MKSVLTKCRAIDDNDKALRKQNILDAAQDLYHDQPQQLPSVITIARKAGLAKGTVYLYFKTKEEIFLNLLGTYYRELLVGMENTALMAEKDDPRLIPALVDKVTDFVHLHPDFMPLATMANSVLEPNVDVARIMEFKELLFSNLARLGNSLAAKISIFSAEQCRHLLVQTNAIILGLWQMQNLPSAVLSAMSDAHRQALVPEFDSNLREAMTLLWRGAVASGTE